MPLTTSIDDLFAAASQQASVAEGDSQQPIYTGRYIAVFKDDATQEAIRQFQETYSLKVASADSFDGQAVPFEDLGDAEILVFPTIGAALVSGEAYASMNPSDSTAVAEEGTGAVVSDSNSPIASMEREVFVYATGTATVLSNATYGLDLTLVTQSSYSGDGIKVCVLDTGIDLSHPDFAGRSITTATFVGQPIQDGHSHGTHTAGTACGPQTPGSNMPRYGVAYNAQIFVGKVLSNSGKGTTATTLAGINWAIANGCQIVSMSLSAPVGEQASYTQAGTKALAAGTLLIAAAGNDSKRPATIAQTGAPANSPTIMSVAALDQSLNIAPFSNGGKIDIAGPGVDVLSSVPSPTLYGKKSGTSMATPHVSGIAALWAESDSSYRGQALWSALTGAAKPVGADSSDVGAGIVQAPTSAGVCQ